MVSPENQPHVITIRSYSPSSRILLRSPIRNDAASFVGRVQDPLCTVYLPHLQSPKVPITLASQYKQIAAWRADSLIKSLILVMVLLDSSPEAEMDEELITDLHPSEEIKEINSGTDDTATIGETGFGSIDYVTKTAECGIMLNSSPEIRGKGYAVEALEMMFAYAFDHLNLEVVEFGTHRDNVPMQSVLGKKFGIPAEWREDKNDWVFSVTKCWWNLYPGSSGEKMRVEVRLKRVDIES